MQVTQTNSFNNKTVT